MTYLDGGSTMVTMACMIVSTSFRQIIAYIDPGTGSLILQLLLGGVAGAWVMIKLFGRRIAAMFGMARKETDAESSGDSSHG